MRFILRDQGQVATSGINFSNPQLGKRQVGTIGWEGGGGVGVNGPWDSGNVAFGFGNEFLW